MREFAQGGLQLAGEVAVGQLARLCEGLGEQPGTIAWGLQGACDAHGRAWLAVQARGEVMLTCQRCLRPFSWQADVANRLRLVDSQAELDAADALEASGQGEDVDHLLATERLAPLALVEDELILAMPYAPRHAHCQGPGEPEAQERESSPFAVLRHLGKH